MSLQLESKKKKSTNIKRWTYKSPIHLVNSSLFQICKFCYEQVSIYPRKTRYIRETEIATISK